MNTEDIQLVTIIGGGLMGRQIALNNAIYGVNTIITDNNPEILLDVEKWMQEYLQGRVSKGRFTDEQVTKIKEKFHIIKNLNMAIQDADIVIEAIIEDKEIKRELFHQLNIIVDSQTILVTNSSFMYSSVFADCIDHPERLANFHYFNPALVMKLVEVVKGPHTSMHTVETLLNFAKKVGKEPVLVKKEIEGFIANRLLRSVANEALFLLENEVATPEEIDIAAEKGLNYPLGPFKLMDLTGVDLTFLNLKRVYYETGKKNPGYDLLEKKYIAKEWGRKTGKGWYIYDNKKVEGSKTK